MSTNSTITLKLRPEDVGRIKKCDLNKCKVKTKKTFRSEILPNQDFINKVLHGVKLSKPYIRIYHHWDGYPDGLGKYLREHYNTYDSILNLLLIGDCSTIINGVIPYIGQNNDGSKGWEKRKWEENRPHLDDVVIPCQYNYQYLAVPDQKDPDKVIWYWRENTTWRNENGKFTKI